MSEPKLVSPLLDGFSMGNPMSEHNGVRCCPAIKDNTDKKYIVKIISVPATQAQLDALLLAGAYKDPADAMDYFRQVGEGILKEAELLKTLSKLDGFLPYEGWQMEPITRHRLGYEVYLVGSYKRSLEKYLKKTPVTHLGAINLGLDLCAALSVCREAGALYVDLKPSNIFVSEKKEYRIGDLGFVEMDALSYTALPDKYHSPYTPPELLDPMGSLNLSVDTYAVGMILYQLYNDGQLPFKGLRNPEEALPTPLNADYELAEIIMKAIHADPAERWSDPKDLGKALAAYMQRNSVNDVPITPHTPLDVNPEDIVAIPKKKKKAAAADDISEPLVIPEEADNPIFPSEADPEKSISSESTTETVETSTESVEDPAAEEEPEEVCAAEPSEAFSEEQNPEDDADAPEQTPEEPQETEIISGTPTKNLSEEEEPEPDSLPPEEMSEELSRIVAKADELIAHELPEDAIMPEIEEVPDPFAFITEDSDEPDDSDIPEDPVMESEADNTAAKASKKKKKEQKFADPKYKRRTRRFFTFLLLLLLLAAASVGGYWYYQNLYLLPIDDISISGTQNELTVTVDSAVDPSLLSVVCSDSYGNVKTSGLTDGKAVFTSLVPNTLYTVELKVDGFHALVGKTSDMFTTEATTRILNFSSIAGSEDGSVMLTFTVDGEEPDDWTLIYGADGQEPKRKTFKGHSVNVSDLSVGSVYTFRLEAGEGLDVGGETELQLMATRLILAENMTVTSDTGSEIVVRWDAPGDVIVDSWGVRCYNIYGYEESVTVTDTEAVFSNIDPTRSYTVEVTAAGMTQPSRTSISENPIRITDLKVDHSKHEKLKVTWDYTGEAPKDGWLLIYSYVGGQKSVVKSEKPTAEIPLNIPGAQYTLSVQAADGTTVFNNTSVYNVPEASDFDKHSLTKDNLSVDLVKTPSEETWYFESLGNDAIQTSFTSGEKISIVMRSTDTFYMTSVDVDVLFVVRDTYGNILPDYVEAKTLTWKKIWDGGEMQNGELDFSAVPTAAGDYVLNLYFDGMSVAQLNFTITQ